MSRNRNKRKVRGGKTPSSASSDRPFPFICTALGNSLCRIIGVPVGAIGRCIVETAAGKERQVSLDSLEDFEEESV